MTATGSATRIGHFTHHKSGTAWFLSILRDVATVLDAPFVAVNVRSWPSAGPLVALDWASRLRPDELGISRGTHMIRDPRDVVVSAYHYHKWCSEPWVGKWIDVPGSNAIPSGRSYQQHLRSLAREPGMLLTSRVLSGVIDDMMRWQPDERVLELRYEDVFEDYSDDRYGLFWERILRFYLVPDALIDRCVGIARFHSFPNVTSREEAGDGTKRHARVGTAGQWRTEMPDVVLNDLVERKSLVLKRLGYRK